MMKATLDQHKDAIVSGIPLGRIGQDSDMAATAIFLASKGSCWITGAVIPVEGGMEIAARM